MQRVGMFHKVSFEQFEKDMKKTFGDVFTEDVLLNIYKNIKLPERATSGSAGYDFFSPIFSMIHKGDSVVIPTGIRCEMKKGWVLGIYPRSGQGFKYGVHLANTVGIIDSDYYHSDNEGHIFIKFVNDSCISDGDIPLAPGIAMAQGIFMPYGLVYNDNVDAKRNGGFGSTDGK